jgi:hypothetical protein
MTNLFIIVGIVITLVVVVGIFKAQLESDEKDKAKYQYKRRNFFLT